MTEKRWLYLALAVAVPFSSPAPSLAGDGVVALQSAAPSCPDGSGNVYVDCGNGTVTDNRTGLVWLKNADCFGQLDWSEAMATVAGLGDLDCSVTEGESCDCGLSDGSSPGEWRLPPRREWKTMIADAVTLGCVDGEYGGPSITDDSGTQCWQEGPGNSFSGVVSSFYWSASTYVFAPSDAWGVALSVGGVFGGNKASDAYVWPVRGGQ